MATDKWYYYADQWTSSSRFQFWLPHLVAILGFQPRYVSNPFSHSLIYRMWVFHIVYYNNCLRRTINYVIIITSLCAESFHLRSWISPIAKEPSRQPYDNIIMICTRSHVNSRCYNHNILLNYTSSNVRSQSRLLIIVANGKHSDASMH